MERPSFRECVCELCDCGHHKHHMNCTKQQRMVPQKSKTPWLSQYQATYICPPMVHPRSSKRPLRTPPYPNPPPMDFRTTQRVEFIAWKTGKRPKLHVEEGHYQPPQEPFQSQTLYRLHFPLPEPVPRSVRHPATQLQCHDIFQHMSTSKEVKGEQTVCYGRLPALPGEHGLATAYQPTLHSLSWGKKSPLGRRMGLATDRCLTKYQSDFPARSALPAQTAPARPPLDNLKINESFRHNFQTVQRDSYRGWDASRYPRAELIVQKGHLRTERAEKFEVDTVSKGKVETQTTTQSTYLPKKADKAKSCKPEMKPIQLEGRQYFNTVHRATYRPLPPPCLSPTNILNPVAEDGKGSRFWHNRQSMSLPTTTVTPHSATTG